MSVILRKRKNSDGTTSLRLDIYHNGRRIIETLKHLQLAKPSNILDRENNKELLRQAEQIKVARAAELEASNYNMVSDAGKKTFVIGWMQDYVDAYDKKDKRNMQGAFNRFKDFLAEEKKTQLTFAALDALLIEDFMDYLDSKSTGEGALSYFARFKKMVKYAYRRRLLKDNVLDLVEKKLRGKPAKKEILSLDELKKLAATPTESAEIKRAFLFSCVTGLRWRDVNLLDWRGVNLETKEMSIIQAKTDEPVLIPLNDTAISLLGEKKIGHVFTLPSANGANKTLKAWVKRAKIDKTITWHCARHSYGTNLILTKTDLLTTSKLMGHTSVKHTQRYVDTAAELKKEAINKLNIEL